MLRKLYELLEASKDIIKEIKKKDYNSVKVEVDEREVKRRAEGANEETRFQKPLQPFEAHSHRDTAVHDITGKDHRRTNRKEGYPQKLPDIYSPKRLGDVFRKAYLYNAISPWQNA